MNLSDLYQGLTKQAEEQEKTAAEEDAYGRIMAHAFADELEKMAMCEKCGKEECNCPSAKEEENKEEAPAQEGNKEEAIKALKKAMLAKAMQEKQQA